MRRYLIILKAAALSFLALVLSTHNLSAQSEEITFGPNDVVRLKVFEWRALDAQLVEWPGLSGEFQISASGNLFLPLIGELPAESTSPRQLAAVIEENLKERAGMADRPTVTVEVARFSPIYVLGEVERPNEYAFRPGMTVLNALSLAGGMYRTPENSTWSPSKDAIQAAGNLRAIETSLTVLLARRARLEAELQQAETITFPDELVGTLGTGLAQRVMDQERLIMTARLNALRSQTEALEDHKRLLEQEIASLQEQTGIKAQQQVTLETELANVRSLVAEGLAVQQRELSLQREVADFQADQLELKTSILRAQQDLTQSDLRIFELRDRYANELSTELLETLAEIEDLYESRSTAEQVVRGATAAATSLLGLEAGTKQSPVVFTIVHTDGTTTDAEETTLMMRGDVLKVEYGALPEISAGVRLDEALPQVDLLARQ